MEASVRRYLERQVVLHVLTLESYLSEHARAVCNRTKALTPSKHELGF